VVDTSVLVLMLLADRPRRRVLVMDCPAQVDTTRVLLTDNDRCEAGLDTALHRRLLAIGLLQ